MNYCPRCASNNRAHALGPMVEVRIRFRRAREPKRHAQGVAPRLHRIARRSHTGRSSRSAQSTCGPWKTRSYGESSKTKGGAHIASHILNRSDPIPARSLSGRALAEPCCRRPASAPAPGLSIRTSVPVKLSEAEPSRQGASSAPCQGRVKLRPPGPRYHRPVPDAFRKAGGGAPTRA